MTLAFGIPLSKILLQLQDMHAIKWHGKFSDPREWEEGQQMHQTHSNFADHASVLTFFMLVTFVLCYKPKRLNPCNKGSLSSLDISIQQKGTGWKNGFVMTITFLVEIFYQTIWRTAWKSKVFSWQTVVFLWWSGPIKTNISHSISMRSQFSWYNNKQTNKALLLQRHKKESNQQLGTRHQNYLARRHILLHISYKDILLPMVLEMN